MRTPPSTYYATEAEAFAALLAPSEAFEHGGGVLACGLEDSACVDNQGAVAFSARSLCDP
ncbi:MAG: hypothetical protein H6710_22840 [Myxococcales bacterium]|nr:hypothetical protein [Myxococcales bacterium]